MTRLYARTLIAIGLAGFLFAGGRLAFVGLTHAESPLAPVTYFVCPEGGPAHVRGCPYVNWNRTDLIKLPGRRAAEKSGFCEECLRGEQPQRTASAQFRQPVPEGTN